MSELNTLLDKINETVELKIEESNAQERKEQEQKDNYISQIKRLAPRIKDMLTLVNALCSREIPRSDHKYQLLYDLMEKLDEENCPIFFTGEKKFSNPPYTYVGLSFKEGYTSCRLVVSANKDIKVFHVWDGSEMSEYDLNNLNNDILFSFIVEFQRTEEIIREYIVEL